MPTQQAKFKNPYLKVIKGRIVPACEIEKRQEKLANKQQQKCQRLNGWIDHKFQNFSYFLLDCFDKRKHQTHYMSDDSCKMNDTFDSSEMNTSFGSITSTYPLSVNLNKKNSLTKTSNHLNETNNHSNKQKLHKNHENIEDSISIVGDLFIFSCSSSMNQFDQDHGYFSLDGSINNNFAKQDTVNNKNTQSCNIFENNQSKYKSKKKIKSASNLSKKVKFNLLHSMNSTSSFTYPNSAHRHSINHVTIIENCQQRKNSTNNLNYLDNQDDKEKITFAYLFGNLNLFASIEDQDDDEDIESCLILEHNSQDCCCNTNSDDANSLTIDFSSVIHSEEDDALSYDITSL